MILLKRKLVYLFFIISLLLNILIYKSNRDKDRIIKSRDLTLYYIKNSYFLEYEKILKTLQTYNLSPIERYKLFNSIILNSRRFGISVDLILKVIKIESNFNPRAVSYKGAIGLMQIMPTTAELIAKDLDYDDDYNLFDINTNITFGTYFLSHLIQLFNNDTIRALSFYNAGYKFEIGKIYAEKVLNASIY